MNVAEEMKTSPEMVSATSPYGSNNCDDTEMENPIPSASSADGSPLTEPFTEDGSPSTPEFCYEPLAPDSIRLIILQPNRTGKKTGVVHCRLVHRTFACKPQYEALSYTWGDIEPTETIYVNGAPLRVRANLYLALSHFRQGEPRTLWADAICIDQSNDQERSIQVGFMDIIFQRAQGVRIWLGCVSKFDSLPQLQDHALINFLLSPRNILSLPYWNRAWIIQEIGLSTNLSLHVGSASMEWSYFVDRLQWGNTGAFTGDTYHQRSHILKLDLKRRERHGDRNRLEQLLEDFQNCQCKEAQDKVFAFLGLASDSHTITADYSKPLFGVFGDLVDFFCERKLLDNGATNELDRSMRIIKFSQLLHKLLQKINNPHPDLSRRATIVQVRGAKGGSIIHLGPAYDLLFSSPKAERQWKQSFSNGYYNKPQHTTALKKAYESYFPILLKFDNQILTRYCDIDPQKLYSKASKTRRPWQPDEVEWKHQELDNEPGRDCEDSPIIKIAPNSDDLPRLFLGTEFLMGLVPPQAQEGDIICHFWECDTVALLRKEETTEVMKAENCSPSPIYRVVGRVHLSTGSLNRDLTPQYNPWVVPPKNAVIMHIQMDVTTLHVLTR